MGIAGNSLDAGHRARIVGIDEAEQTDQHLLRLVLDVLAIAPPMRFELKSGIQNGRHIPRVQLVVGAARLWQAIRAIEGGLMAAGPAHGPVNGDSRIEENLPANLTPCTRAPDP